MGAKTGAKAGRPLKQNGKGKVQDKEENRSPPVGPDFSLLRKPVEISVTGLNEVVKVFQSCPPELHHLLSYECDIIYECKVCRNLFRSLVNFISHKRVYCTQLHGNAHNNLSKNKRVNDTTVIVEPEPVRTTRSRESWRTSDAAGGKDDKGGSEAKARNGQTEAAPFRITIKKDLTSIVEKLMHKNSTQMLSETVGHLSSSSGFYDNVCTDLNERRKEAKQHTIHLEPIENTSFGVFQTIVQTSGSATELIKSQVQDLQRIMSDTEAVLGPDGRVIENGSTQNNSIFHEDRKKKIRTAGGEEYNGPPVTAPESEVELFCNICKEGFASYKILNHHMKSLHMTFRTFYPCPCCKLPLSNSWSVYRHLLKVHRKTNEQIRKLREKVIKRSFRKEVLQSGAQKLIKPNVTENPLCPSELIYDTSYKPTVNEEDSDKHWFGHIEDGLDMQCCRGCGRRFERRAALLAHSQSCLKQLAVKSNVQLAARQSDKTSAVGRLPHSSKTAAPSVPSAVSTLRPAATLPVHPINHSLHLIQGKQATPTKKIEIQIRRDYGKSQNSHQEFRARTPSISRSEDSAPSVSRSEDGTTSGSSETEGSDKGLQVKKEVDSKLIGHLPPIVDSEHKRVTRLSFPTQTLEKVSGEMTKANPPLKRGVGRPRKRMPDVMLQVNGVKDEKSPSAVYGDSDDSNDKSEEMSRNNKSRKRKAIAQITDGEIEDESKSSNSINETASVTQKNEPTTSASSNDRKLQCLTCLKDFKSPDHLRRHVALHIGWNRFRCVMCGFKCFSKADCISHALRKHLDPWDKEKAVALVQDIQIDAGGSTDVQPFDIHADTGESSDSAGSDSGTHATTPEKSDDSSSATLQAMTTLDDLGEIISVA